MPILSPASEPRVHPIRIGRRPISSIGADIGDTNLPNPLTVLGVIEKPEIQTKRSETETLSEMKLFISSDTENTAKTQSHQDQSAKHGSHAGSRTGATSDAFSIPSHVYARTPCPKISDTPRFKHI